MIRMDIITSSLIVLRFVFHQVFLGCNNGLHTEINKLPRLVFILGEKRLGFTHYKEAGAMKELVPIKFLYMNNLTYLYVTSLSFIS